MIPADLPADLEAASNVLAGLGISLRFELSPSKRAAALTSITRVIATLERARLELGAAAGPSQPEPEPTAREVADLLDQLLWERSVSHPGRARVLAALDRGKRPRRTTEFLTWIFDLRDLPAESLQQAAQELRKAYDEVYDAPAAPPQPEGGGFVAGGPKGSLH